MTRLARWMIPGALLGVFLLAPQTARAADPMAGTWELNIASSMFDPGPPPKSAVRTCEVNGDTMTVIVDMVASDGTPRRVRYTARLDGKDYPISGAPNIDTIALARVDERTIETTQKRTGKAVRTDKIEVSEDGRQLTIATKGRASDGEEVSNLLVFDKR